MNYVTTFKVCSKGYFPMDMLRYDACFPSRSEDAAMISEYTKEIVTVELETYHDSQRDGHPTVDRWRSFGWTVVETQTRKWK